MGFHKGLDPKYDNMTCVDPTKYGEGVLSRKFSSYMRNQSSRFGPIMSLNGNNVSLKGIPFGEHTLGKGLRDTLQNKAYSLTPNACWLLEIRCVVRRIFAILQKQWRGV